MWCIHKTILEGPWVVNRDEIFTGEFLKTPKENGRAHLGTYVCRTRSRFHRLLITGQKKKFLANKKQRPCFNYWIWNPMMKNNIKIRTNKRLTKMSSRSPFCRDNSWLCFFGNNDEKISRKNNWKRQLTTLGSRGYFFRIYLKQRTI